MSKEEMLYHSLQEKKRKRSGKTPKEEVGKGEETMFHVSQKARAVVAATVLGLLVVLLAACGSTSVQASGATSRDIRAISTSVLTVTVQPYQTPFTVYEVGSTMSQVVATGTDALGPGDTIIATIDWGDKTAPTRYFFIDGRTFQVTGAHAYSKVGTYPITVTVAIPVLQQSASGTGTISVVPAYTINGTSIQAGVGKIFSGVVATGTDPFPNDALKGTIDWGDGTTPASTQTTSSSNGSYQVNSMHTYAVAGTYTVTISLTSTIVGPISGTTTAVAGVPVVFTLHSQTITVKAGHLFHGSVATVTGTISSGGLRVIIEWGDGTTSKLSLLGGKGSLQINGSHTYSQVGTYSLTIIVKDNGTGEQANARGTVMVI